MNFSFLQSLKFVDFIYASKFKLTLEQVWNVWSDPRDLIKTQTYQKIQDTFSKFEKNFTEKSEPLFLDKMGKKISLKKIHEIESIEGKPISMIAVTRHQYDISNFPKYVEYIKKNNLGTGAIYYGLWSDGYTVEDVEFDVLYVIHTENHDQIQEHLNKHDNMNKGKTQAMALMLLSRSEEHTS